MEQAEINSQEKALKTIEKFSDQFSEIIYTIHLCDIKNEVRGKSSNVSWASREMVKKYGQDKERIIFTVMDSDTSFSQDYFASLSYYYSSACKEDRELMLFAPCISFDRYFYKIKQKWK